MKRFSWLSVAILLIVVISLLPLTFAGAAHADSANSNLRDITQAADSILVGSVTRTISYWNEEHTRIFTSAVFSVEDTIKGEATPGNVTITVPGGIVDGIGEWVSDMASLEQGERAVVFVKRLNQTPMPQANSAFAEFPAKQFEIYGGHRGKFPVKGDKVDSLSVTEFKGRINKVLSGQALPASELDIAPSVVTVPYLYGGYNWPHPPSPVVPYRINENTSDSSDEGAAVQRAAATWSASGANFSFNYAGTTTATAPGRDNVNEIMWANMGNISTLAVTYIWYSGSYILENDIEYNDYYNWSTSPTCPSGYFDVQSVGLHEFGHWLFLADLYNSSDASKVMYGYSSSGTTKRALTSDDIAGIQSIYGSLTIFSVITTTLPNGELGVPYSQTLQATGGSGSYSWSISSGTLPAGLGLVSGVISGIPTTTGTSAFTVRVNDGSTTADQPLAITITGPLQKLVGVDDAAVLGAAGGGYLILDKTAAVATGDVTQIRVKCTTSGNVKVALYNDSSGSPDTLINANNTGAAVVAGWNNISLPSTPVTPGTNYWIAYISSVNCVGYFSSPGGGVKFRALAYASDFPASAGTGFITSTNNHPLIAGWGVAAPTPLTILTAFLPDGAVGAMYSQTLQAIGGSGSYTWSMPSGTLPAGLGLVSGVISGIPTTTGISTFTVRVYDGSTTVDQPLSITITNIHKLVGADDAAALGAAGGGYLILDKSAAVATGDVTQIRVKCTTSGNVKVALYNDSSGSPDTLINANNTGAAVVAGWNNITLPSSHVTLGTNYWIAYISSVNCVGYFSSPGGGVQFRSLAYTSDFPASAGTGFITSTNNHSLTAGWGGSIPPVLPDAPLLQSPGTAVTFKWGASTGATTYWLQVNTASNFTGTNIIDAEVGNVTSQEVTGFSLGTTYYWRVKAGNTSGWSNWSSVRSILINPLP